MSESLSRQYSTQLSQKLAEYSNRFTGEQLYILLLGAEHCLLLRDICSSVVSSEIDISSWRNNSMTGRGSRVALVADITKGSAD